MENITPFAEADLSAVVEFVRATDRALSGFSEFDELILKWILRHDRFDIERDTFVLRTGSDIVGFCALWEVGEGEALYSFLTVRPTDSYRTRAEKLLEALTERATDRGRPGTPVRLHIDMFDAPGHDLLEQEGWELVRRNRTMSIEANRAPRPLDIDGIEIRAGTSSDDARLLHRLDQETFAEHWGFVPVTFEEFERRNLQGWATDPSMWLFAYEGDEPIGMAMLEERNEMGWIQALGVRKPWRGRGVAKALLGRSFARLAELGFDKIGLGVDSENATGAFQLYEKAGMHIVRGDDVFEKRLGDA